MVLIVGYGNPLMDCVYRITDHEILTRHNLIVDDCKEISIEALDNLMAEIEPDKCVWAAGGSVQNTLRILQWLLQTTSVMFGSVGNDRNGKLLNGLVKECGVGTRYTTNDNLPTGVVISLVYGETRTLVGNIGAAAEYPEELVTESSNISILEIAYIVIMEGFFLTNGRHKAARKILEVCLENNTKFVFNLSAPYLFENHAGELIHFSKNCTILFGNHAEFTILMRKMEKHYASIKELVLDLVKKKDKIVVITNGYKTVTYGFYPDNYGTHDVGYLDAQEVVDTTGAGDSFVAGFLGSYLKKNEPHVCVKWGCWVAQKVIGEFGCKPPRCDVKELFQISN